MTEHERDVIRKEVYEYLNSLEPDALRRFIKVLELLQEGKIQHDYENACLIFPDEETMKLVENA